MPMSEEFDERKRSGQPAPLGDVFKRLLKAYQLEGKYNEMEVLGQWEELMGKAVALRTTGLKIEHKVLHISLNSSVMREELKYGKEVIIQRINQAAGKVIIEDVWFT